MPRPLNPLPWPGLKVTVIDRSTVITGTWGTTTPRGGKDFTIHPSIYSLNVDYWSVRGQVPFWALRLHYWWERLVLCPHGIYDLLVGGGVTQCTNKWKEILNVISVMFNIKYGFPDGSDGKECACNAGDLGSMLGSGRPSGEGNGNPLWFLPGESHGQRSLAGYSPWGRKRVGHDWVAHTFTSKERCWGVTWVVRRGISE